VTIGALVRRWTAIRSGRSPFARRFTKRTERKPRLLTRWKLSQAPAFLRGAIAWPWAEATAAATSMIP
jgi:hypothetical protein